MEEYTEWRLSQVLADGLDLQQIYENQDVSFFVDKGVKRGVARRFVRDVEYWVKEHRSTENIRVWE